MQINRDRRVPRALRPAYRLNCARSNVFSLVMLLTTRLHPCTCPAASAPRTSVAKRCVGRAGRRAFAARAVTRPITASSATATRSRVSALGLDINSAEARRRLAIDRQQLLSTMVMMGINRVVVTDGKT